VPHDCVHTVERDQHGGFIRIAVMGDPVHQRPSLFDERLHVAAEPVILFARAKLAHKHRVPTNDVRILGALIIFIELDSSPRRTNERNQTFAELHSDRLEIYGLDSLFEPVGRLDLAANHFVKRGRFAFAFLGGRLITRIISPT